MKISDEFSAITPEEEKLGKLGYDESIQILNRIEKSNCPGEKVGEIMRMFAEMKSTVVDHTRGKSELGRSEDQSKVFAYMVANCGLTAPATELHFLHDYLSFQEGQMATEQMVVANLKVPAK